MTDAKTSPTPTFDRLEETVKRIRAALYAAEQARPRAEQAYREASYVKFTAGNGYGTPSEAASAASQRALEIVKAEAAATRDDTIARWLSDSARALATTRLEIRHYLTTAELELGALAAQLQQEADAL